jgi:hypothetical protein
LAIDRHAQQSSRHVSSPGSFPQCGCAADRAAKNDMGKARLDSHEALGARHEGASHARHHRSLAPSGFHRVRGASRAPASAASGPVRPPRRATAAGVGNSCSLGAAACARAARCLAGHAGWLTCRPRLPHPPPSPSPPAALAFPTRRPRLPHPPPSPSPPAALGSPGVADGPPSPPSRAAMRCRRSASCVNPFC